MSGENPYQGSNTEEDRKSSRSRKKASAKTPLVGLGFGLWIGGFMMGNIAKGMIGEGMTPMVRGILFGVGLSSSRVPRSFCFVSFASFIEK